MWNSIGLIPRSRSALGVVATVVAIVAATACTPDIGPGTYWCGPERLCPPDQACNDNTFTCEFADRAERFSCPADTESYEPDEDTASARDVGAITCGGTLLGGVAGCIASKGNVDLYRFELATTCSGPDPHVEVRLSYPFALVGLEVELLDDAGAVVTTSELCSDSLNRSGKDRQCLDATISPGVYYVRVKAIADSPDCGGDCHNNQYLLDVRYPLS